MRRLIIVCILAMLLSSLIVAGGCTMPGTAQWVYKHRTWSGYHYFMTWQLKDAPDYRKERPGVIIYHDEFDEVKYITIMDDKEAIVLEADKSRGIEGIWKESVNED